MYESFQNIDPNFRFNINSLKLFRDRLLKQFLRCYSCFQDYKTLIDQYTIFTLTKSHDLNISKYENNGYFEAGM